MTLAFEKQSDPKSHWVRWAALVVSILAVHWMLVGILLYLSRPTIAQKLSLKIGDFAAWTGTGPGTGTIVYLVQLFVLLGLSFFLVASVWRRYQEQYFRWFAISWMLFLPYYLFRFLDCVPPSHEWIYHALSALNDGPIVVAAFSLYSVQWFDNHLGRRPVGLLLATVAGYYLLLILLSGWGWLDLSITWPTASCTTLLLILAAFWQRLKQSLGLWSFPTAFLITAYALLQLSVPFIEDKDRFAAIAAVALGLKVFYSLAFIMVALGELQKKSSRDIETAKSEHVLAEHETREAKRKWREVEEVLDATDTASYRVKGLAGGTTDRSNSAEARILGYNSPEEIIGRPRRDLYFNPEQEEEFFRKLTLSSDGRVTNEIVTLKKKSGEPVHVEVNCRLLYQQIDGRQTIVGREAVYRDVTDRHLLQMEGRIRKELDNTVEVLLREPANRGPDTLMHLTASRIGNAMKADAAVIALRGPNVDQTSSAALLSLHAISGVAPVKLTPWIFPEGALATERFLCWTGMGSTTCAVLDRLAQAAGLNSILAAPLRRTEHQEPYGYLLLGWTRFPSDYELGRMAKVISDALVPVVGEMERHYSRLRERALELFAFVKKESEPSKYLQAALKLTCDLIPCDDPAARIFDHDGAIASEVTGKNGPNDLPTFCPKDPIIGADLENSWAEAKQREFRAGSSHALIPIRFDEQGPFGYLLLRNRVVPKNGPWSAGFSFMDAAFLEFEASVLAQALGLLLQEMGRNFWIKRLVHEARAPLAGIASCAAMLENRASDLKPELRQRLFSNVQLNCSTIGRIVGNLELVHVPGRLGEKRRMELYGEIIMKTINEQRPNAHEVGIPFSQNNVTVRDFTVIPPLWLDAQGMNQVFTNLVVNAIKYTLPERRKEFRLEIVFAREPDWYRIDVSNWGGIGVNEEERERICREGFRGNQAKRMNAQGMGLGLYVAREIVSAHGGTFTVTSLQEPTTFTIRLPTAAAQRKNPGSEIKGANTRGEADA